MSARMIGSLSEQVARDRRQLSAWVRRFEAVGVVPTDSSEGRFQKAVLTALVVVGSVVVGLWGVVYVVLGAPRTGTISFLHAALALLSLLLFALTKRYTDFRLTQALLLLASPFLVQWSLGGFAAGSAAGIWAFL